MTLEKIIDWVSGPPGWPAANLSVQPKRVSLTLAAKVCLPTFNALDPNWGMVSASNDWLTMDRYPEGKYGQTSGATAVSAAIDVTSDHQS